MKLNINNHKELLPAKVLHNIPNVIDEKDLTRAMGKNVTIVDLGNLSNLKKFMTKHTDHKGDMSSSMKISNNGWSGTTTWDDYLGLLENGDEAVMKKIKIETTKQVAELTKKYKEVIHNYKFDVTGQFFDIGLVLTGTPESWLDPEIEEEEVVKVDILINGAFHSGIKEKVIVKSASRILAMVKIIEDHGVQVGVKMVNANLEYDTGRERSLVTLITLKGHSEPINYRKMSAVLTPAHHRRGVFKVLEVSGEVASGYGAPRPLKGSISLDDNRAIDKLEEKLFKQGV